MNRPEALRRARECRERVLDQINEAESFYEPMSVTDEAFATAILTACAETCEAAARNASNRDTEYGGEYADGLRSGFEAIADDLNARATRLRQEAGGG